MSGKTAMLGNSLAATLRDLARACRILKMEGHGDVTMGHLTLRDPDGRGFWMKRSGIGMGEMREASDFLLLDFDGRRLYGDGAMHIEWPLHAEIFRARPDVNVIGHTHPFHATTFSATRVPLRSVAHDGAMFGGTVPYYTGTSSLIDTPELGRALARSLGDAPAILMRNHGITYVGDNMMHTTLVGIFLEKACKAQLTLAASNMPWSWPEAEEFALKAQQLATPSLVAAFWDFFNRELDRQEGVLGRNDPVPLPAPAAPRPARKRA
jgi:ribulose-5-phosphate 4-epimerase/fuculose-1-phosphate aldolase